MHPAPLRPLLLGCALLLAALAPPAPAGEPPAAPLLRLEAGQHTAMINRIGVDAAGRWLVTGSDDKTLRLWDLASGELVRVLRPPIGEGDEGKLYAAALSPDGRWVAGAGWTKAGFEGTGNHNIYLFDRASGELRHRLPGHGNVIYHLCFSLDGRRLGAALGGGQGLRVWSMERFEALAEDANYGDSSYGCAFAADGRLATTSLDGQIRLYDAHLKLIRKAPAPAGKEPYGIAFSPDGKRIAVGYGDTPRVSVLDGASLEPAYEPDTTGIDRDLFSVAWSQDGRWLHAGGRYQADGKNPVIRWAEGGRGERSAWPAADNTLMDLAPLPDGGLVVGAGDPAWVRLDAQGREARARRPAIADLRYSQRDNFLLSADGRTIRFGLEYGAKRPARFALQGLAWSLDPAPAAGLRPPRTEAPGLKVEGWEDTTTPRLNGAPLAMEDQYERSRSLAISPNGDRLLLGANYTLRLYDRTGKLLRTAAVPGVAWGVNFSEDGRLAVAAFGDGTIRWYRTEDLKERLALFPLRNGEEWVLWTPEGFFAASPGKAGQPGGERYVGYHLNQGKDRAAEFVSASQLYDRFYRPDLVARALDPEYPQLAREALGKIGDVRQLLAQGLPPRLEAAGATTLRSQDGQVTIGVRVKDQGGGVGGLVYRINGVVQERLEGRALDAGGGRIDRPFKLPPGKALVEVVATTRAGVESSPLRFGVTVAGQAEAKPVLHLLAAGVTRYRDESMRLKYAAEDAEALADELARRGQGLFREVKTRILTDRAVTREALERAFAELKGGMAPQDLFILYLAGHGKVENGAYLFIPADLVYTNREALEKGALDQKTLERLLAEAPALKSLLLLDTCYAGAMLASAPKAELAGRGLEQKTAVDRLMRATGRAVIAASSDQQMALEGEGGHGVFTYALLEALRGAADRNHDQRVELTEMAGHVSSRVPEITLKRWNYEQFPMMDLKGMDFPLGLVGDGKP